MTPKQKHYVFVIGGANIDLQGSSDNPLLLKDSNPGEISMSSGGVGRNIAENMSRLGIPTKIFSYVGSDALGNFLIESTQKANVDTSYINRHPTLPTSQYLSVLDDNNDMLVSISDMRIINEMSIDDIRSHKDALNQSSLIVIDTNIPIDVIEYITEEFSHIPLFLDTVSIAKASKIKHLKQIFITLGDEGVFYYDGKDYGMFNQKKIDVVSANGAGDAFVAGMVYGFLNLNGIKETVKYASAAALIALKSKNTISDQLSVENVALLLKEQSNEAE